MKQRYMTIVLTCMLVAVGCGNAQNEGTTTPSDEKQAQITDEPGDSGSEPLGSDEKASTESKEVSADVTEVSVSGDAGAYTFSVTVASADVDCTQYANWWEVVSEAGELQYRRILMHSHTGSGNPFTRDGGPVPIQPDEIVYVRAHMNTVGYNGKVMTGSVNNGFAPAEDLPDDFAVSLADADPQADTCFY